MLQWYHFLPQKAKLPLCIKQKSQTLLICVFGPQKAHIHSYLTPKTCQKPFLGTCYGSINFFYKMWLKDCPFWYKSQVISYSAEIYKYITEKNILVQSRYQSNKKLQKYHFIAPKLRLQVCDDFIGSEILNLYCSEIFMEKYLVFIDLFLFLQKWHFFMLQHLDTSI